MDLSNLEELERVTSLLKDTFLVILNFKAGSSAKLCLSCGQLKTINLQLIYVSVNTYKDNDPRLEFDAMIQAETGWVHMNGQKEGPSVKKPVALMDTSSAHQLKEGVLITLLER